MRISDWSSDVCSSDLISLLWGIGLQIAPLLKTGGTSASLLPNAGSHLSDYTPMQSHASRLRAERGGVRLPSRPDPPSVPVLYPVERLKIGRASCRERVCQSVSISVVAVSLKKKSQL